MYNKIDSNVTGLAFAEETDLKVLPNTPVFYQLEPNTYADFGGDIATVARETINASRQRQKGTVTDLSVTAGFNLDFTKTNLNRLLQGFFFADMREKPSTVPLNGTAIAITGVTTASGDEFTAAAGLSKFKVGHILNATGFGNSANDGLAVLTAVTDTAVTTSKTLTAEASSPAAARLDAVGFEFPAGDVSLSVVGALARLSSTTTDFTTLGLTAGEWVFVGGDAAINKFASVNPGYARVAAIAAHALDFDDTTFTAAADTGAGQNIRLFFGNVLRNENDASLIKRRSFNLERTLGKDASGTQSEYVEGAVANDFTLNFKQADKFNADLSFVGCDTTQRDGATGVKTGTRVAALGEDAFNTSSDVYRMKMAVVDGVTLNPTALFGYVDSGTIKIANNVTGNKAIGTLGNFDVSAGNFTVSGTATAYFSDVAAVSAIRNNSDVGFNAIVAQGNAGFVFDIPLLTLGGGKKKVEKDKPIQIDLTSEGAEGKNGYTMLYTSFSYLPNAAMPA